MITLSANLIALLIYSAAAAYFGSQFIRQQALQPKYLIGTAGLALIAHGIGVYGLSVKGDNLNVSLFSASSLIFWVINAIVLFSSIKKALHNLFLLLFPLSAISVLTSIISSNSDWQQSLSYHIAIHVVLSVLAYSLLTIASLQALLLAYQNHALKNKQLTTSSRLLPPLQTMEALLFEFLWVGEILLTLAIASGFYFLEDMFAQHLAHKTIFALVAWLIYALLLWGRHQLGWRGNTAIRWTLAGFVCLMLAYFGSKLVLEIILHRV
ncbi:cytochrome C assembly protein [Cellvibrio sp. BR]|uniref:cytochrome C assembly family protein n=1 Tax=Cellvibrio sp. BR TaxID=1134474 RepID=UPI0002601492|nr:cytochrome c biogenesis protein CcsA [Cellvibrio sp. BR]EIK45842.1 cytochrome C assembly protein [Cellvibrio sp. BR]